MISFATSVSTINDPKSAPINAVPFRILCVCITANTQGNKIASKITSNFIRENLLSLFKSERNTLRGGIFLISDNGKKEKIPEINIPSSNPFSTAPQAIPTLISTGIYLPNITGTRCCIPIPSNTPAILPNKPSTIDWMKKILNDCHAEAPIHRNTAINDFFCCT